MLRKEKTVDQMRNLKIKTGVLKRISKELAAYSKEQSSQQARIDKLISNEADIHDIRKQQVDFG